MGRHHRLWRQAVTRAKLRDELIQAACRSTLTRFHGCGLGRFPLPLDPGRDNGRWMAVRLASLTHGWSGISVELAQFCWATC